MSWNDIKDYDKSVLQDGDAIALFKSEEDAQAFLDWKSLQPNPNENDYDLGQYIDTSVDIQINAS